jgi:hypothetical protein
VVVVVVVREGIGDECDSHYLCSNAMLCLVICVSHCHSSITGAIARRSSTLMESRKNSHYTNSTLSFATAHGGYRFS